LNRIDQGQFGPVKTGVLVVTQSLTGPPPHSAMTAENTFLTAERRKKVKEGFISTFPRALSLVVDDAKEMPWEDRLGNPRYGYTPFH